jgi:hypothetical protein
LSACRMATVVSNFAAMPMSVSPACTV